MRDVILWKTIKDPWTMLKTHGISKMEVRIDPDMMLRFINTEAMSVASKEDGQRVIDYLAEKRVRIEGILLLTKFDGQTDENSWIKNCSAFARQTGVKCIRIDHWKELPATLKETEELLISFEKRLENALKIADDYGINLALENHGPLSNRPEIMTRLIERYSGKGFRICFDTGNFYVTGGLALDDVYKTARLLAPYTASAHLKNASYPQAVRNDKRDIKKYPYGIHSTPVEYGDVNHATLFQIFREAGYKGCFFYEDEVLYHLDKTTSFQNNGKSGSDIMPKTLEYLKKYLAV